MWDGKEKLEEEANMKREGKQSWTKEKAQPQMQNDLLILAT